MKGTGRASLNLKSSLCTDNPTGSDVYNFDDQPTQIVENTGMERNGGITAIYEQETTFATAGANSIITASGDLLQVDASNYVRLNDNVLGNVGGFSIYDRGVLPGKYRDVAWTATGTILGIYTAGNVVTLDEWNPLTKAVINTRNISFAGLTFVPYKIFFVRYIDMAYVDNQEFIATLPTLTPYRLRESDVSVTFLALGATYLSPYTNCWRFAAGKYIIWTEASSLPNAINSWCYIGDIGAWTFVNIKYVVIERFPGTAYSRAILTFPGYKNAGNVLSGAGEVGYNSSGVYSASITYWGPNIAAVTVANSQTIVGPGYSELICTRSDLTATTPYQLLSPYPGRTGANYIPTVFYDSNTLYYPFYNGYGKLTANYDSVAAAMVGASTAIRCCMISGVPSYLSVSESTSRVSSQDSLGVPITNVGEFDAQYAPHIVDNNSNYTKAIYKYNGRLFYIDIRSGVSHKIQKISDSIYFINCISPINIVDTSTGKLELGPNDFNGRMILDPTYGNAGASHQYEIVLKNNYSNSIDTGVKFGPPLGAAPSNVAWLPGTGIPTFVTMSGQYEFDGFYDNVYQTSWIDISGARGATLNQIDQNKTGTLYVPDTRLPFSMGYTFGDKSMVTEIETIMTGVGVAGQPDIDYDYAGYELGNDISGIFKSFYLFGQRYLFDGFSIWLASFNGSLYSTKEFVCQAIGMQYVAVSPTEAYFLSTEDYSLYTFTGGRSLTKVKRMNDIRNTSNGVELITTGVYNVRDNTLLLQTASNWIWVRDGIVSETFKKANQTGTTMYDTQDGIVIANNTLKWTYDFKTRGTTTTTGGTAVTTVVPLRWQSAYHSLKGNELSIAHNWIITFYSPEGPIPVNYTLRCHSFDQDKYNVQRADGVINPSDWDALNFFRARIQPMNRKALASSVQIDTTKHIIITDVTVEYSDDTQAVIAGSRST